MVKCPHCSGTSFTLEEARITKAAFLMYWVACSTCHAPITTIYYRDPGKAAHDVDEKVDQMQNQIRNIAASVDRIAVALNQLTQKLVRS